VEKTLVLNPKTHFLLKIVVGLHFCHISLRGAKPFHNDDPSIHPWSCFDLGAHIELKIVGHDNNQKGWVQVNLVPTPPPNT